MAASTGKRHVVITGGAGFVGSHLCDAFLARGYSVTAVDNEVTGTRSNLVDAMKSPDFRFVPFDVCEPIPEAKLELLRRDGLAGVLHFACPASPVDFDRIPFQILRVDSEGTRHTVDLARRHGARYLLASTSEVYGDPEVHPQVEDYRGNVSINGPRACYDEAKRFAEAWVSHAVRGGEGLVPVNAGIVRIFNTYGPRMRTDDGRVVPELCRQAIQGEPLTIHGDGSQTRSFCYVSDLVEGIVRYFESGLHEPVNLGNPAERTILEFAEAVRSVSGGPRISIRHLPGRPDDPRRRCPDISRAKARLGGWEPEVSLEQGLRATCDDLRSRLPAGSA